MNSMGKEKCPGLQAENSIFMSVTNASRAPRELMGINLTIWNRSPFWLVSALTIPVAKYF